jgi:hypothetical protein
MIKRLVEAQVEDKLVNMILEYASEYNMTILNVKEATIKVIDNMEANATLKMEGSFDTEPSIQ